MFESLEETIGYATTQTSRNIIRLLAFHLKQCDITPEQWTVLKRLSEEDRISQKELSQRADKDKATLTRILEIMERKEFICKETNQDDKRSFLILITEKGRQLKEEMRPVLENILKNGLLQGIPEDKLDIYLQVLAQMNSNALSCIK